MFVVVAAAGGCRGQQMLRQNHPRSQPGAEGTMTAFANAVETIAGSDHPGIRGWTLQLFAKVFKYRGRLRGERCKVINRFINASSQTRGRDVVAEDSTIDDLREKSGLRDEFAHQVRNVFLTLRRESLLIASTTAKRDHNDFSLGGRGCGTSPGRAQQGTA